MRGPHCNTLSMPTKSTVRVGEQQDPLFWNWLPKVFSEHRGVHEEPTARADRAVWRWRARRGTVGDGVRNGGVAHRARSRRRAAATGIGRRERTMCSRYVYYKVRKHNVISCLVLERRTLLARAPSVGARRKEEDPSANCAVCSAR